MSLSAEFVAGLAIGLPLGIVLAAVWIRSRGDGAEKAARVMLDAMRVEQEEARARNEQMVRSTVRDVVAGASAQALASSSENFLALASTRLDQYSQRSDAVLEARRREIGGDMAKVAEQLGKVEGLLGSIESQRAEQFGALGRALSEASERTGALQQTTEELRRALASARARGQWGEQMADNVLSLLGLREGIDYQRQRTVEGGRARPDFTFRLPRGLSVNMDVKFPFDNYQAYLVAADTTARASALKAFLADVRGRIREVTVRDYINPAAGTVDYVLVFIPNEQVFAFIQESDPSIVEEAFRRKVIMCSPFTLYALLAVIHRAVGVFALEQRSQDVLQVVAELRKAWEQYRESMERMGRHIEAVRGEYDKLVSTRRGKLDRTFDRIGALEAGEPGVVVAGEEIGIGEATGAAQQETPATSASDSDD
ncbi:MAG: DNA recombination protein RmuC [Deltaproteobacteria bacterium]|nr:DNA recombination protein RmuC [Deltaproteobacteria bacterium]